MVNGVASTNKNDIQLAELDNKNTIKQAKIFQQYQLDFMAELEEKSVIAARSTMYVDDTMQERDLIVEALMDNEEDMSVREIYLMLKQTFDDNPENKINVPSLIAKKNCTKEELDDGECGTNLVSITPGQKLLDYFNECTLSKTKLVVEKTKNQANHSSIAATAARTNDGIAQINSSSAISKKTEEQKNLSCTPDQFKNKLCLGDISKEDYQEFTARNIIIPNANLSPANALNPPKIGGLEFSAPDAEMREVLEYESLDYTELEENPDQKQDQIPIVYTYKNTNQLKGALDFMDNIVSQELISNQTPQDRQKVSSSEFQARYLNRMANLSLARTVLNDTVKIRVGKNLSEVWKGDSTLSGQDQFAPKKESVLGAGELDHLYSRIDETFAKLKMYDNDPVAAAEKDKLQNASKKYWPKQQLELIKLQNELLFKQFLQNEQIEMLKAAQLANKVNSAENVLYLRKLRKGE
jgi:hypothetical protein